MIHKLNRMKSLFQYELSSFGIKACYYVNALLITTMFLYRGGKTVIKSVIKNSLF